MGFAEAERLCDILCAMLPSCVVVKLPVHPDDWEEKRSNIGDVLGLEVVPSPVVWTDTLRVIGNLRQFSQHVFRLFGVVCDLGPKQLRRIAGFNLKESALERDRKKLVNLEGKRALIVVDVQNDFCKRGSLAVPDGDAVIGTINSLMARSPWDLVVFSQDFHPRDHISFASNHSGAAPFEVRVLDGVGEQTLWPNHCVQGSLGCEFHPYLDTSAFGDTPSVVVRKGMNKLVDSYSAFGDAKGHTLEKTPLEDILRDAGITDVYVCGLAFDFCVSFTAKDAASAGFNVVFVEDASRAITEEGKVAAADAMTAMGITLVPSTAVPTFADYEVAHKLAGRPF